MFIGSESFQRKWFAAILCAELQQVYTWVIICVVSFPRNGFAQHVINIEVQKLASSAVKWCKAAGGKIPRHDLVGKLSKLATSGKHPQNAERDLQRRIAKIGGKLGVKVDHAKVRLHNPTTSAIYTADLPMLCPISLASAIWRMGPEIFEHIFLGSLGREGARCFWQNAKKRCDWFSANPTPAEAYDRLIPLSLYGDDVQAYRNSDPGAVSVVGWMCDFGYMNKAVLQTMLATVYAEYTACEYTYNDVLEYLLPKLRLMSDPTASHPWHAAGFKFLLAGVRGDLKWLNVAWLHNVAFLFACFI